MGRLPEGKKQSLKTRIREEVNHLRSQKPDLKLVVTADGEKGNWTFSKSLNPDVEVLDFWHAAEYLKGAADAAFGSDEKASTKWFERKRHTLRHEPKDVGKVIDALRHLERKGQGSAEIQKTVTAHPLYKPLKLRNSFRANCSVKMPLSPLATTI